MVVPSGVGRPQHMQLGAGSARGGRTSNSSSSDLALHVGGWYSQQDSTSAVQQTTAAPAFVFSSSSQQRPPLGHDTVNGHFNFGERPTEARPGLGQKRLLGYSTNDNGDDNDDGRGSGTTRFGPKRAREQQQQQQSRELATAMAPDYMPLSLAPHSGGVRIDDLLNPAAATLSSAHRMTVPTSLSRTLSADAKHHYRQLAQLHLQLQRPAPAVDPKARLVRTSTAPTDRPGSGSGAGARGLVREALELDKLYDIACVIIESIWSNHSTSQRTQLCSLRCFVAETHRQSRLGIDALELSMFYLLRAKSIIQAKQRSERQKEEQQEQLMLQQQKAAAAAAATHHAEVDPNTPPLSPATLVPTGSRRASAMGPAVSIVLPAGVMVPPTSSAITSPLSSSGPITPESAQQAQVGYVALTKQQQLLNGMITPLTPEKAKRALAGSTHSLPNSYRSFVSAKPGPLQVQTQLPGSSGAERPNPAFPRGSKPLPATAGAQKSNVTKCGRRMFVAALISASKFMYDQTYSNKAWNKITKLPPAQISDMERAFLDMIDYRLYVDRSTYDKFHRLLARSGMRNGRLMVCDPLAASSAVATPGLPTPSPSPAASVPSSASDRLAARASALSAAVPSPPTPVSRPSTTAAPADQFDLRTAMNVPVSIASTPIIVQQPASRATTSA
ncbi:PHO85 cyclin-5 [Coemansia sp. RSA 552]|nr:PHO85 cyclin-5 [Coemansia sp. RSA 552]